MTRKDGRLHDAGITLVELVITATLVIVMVFVVTTLSISGTDAQKYSERINRVTEISQEIVEEIRADVVSSTRLFTNDAVGNAYRNMLAGANMPPPIVGRLPTLDAYGSFERDIVGNEKTGNHLLFARHAWTDRFRCPTTGTILRIDVYRLVGYYLSRDGAGPRANSNTGLNLCKFVGEPMADGQQLDQITVPTDLTEILTHLHNATPDVEGETHPRVELVWRLGQDPTLAGTFRQILSTGALSLAPQAPRNNFWQVVADTKLSVPGMLGYRHFSVASNFARPAMGVSRFALKDTTGDGFPHGFELQLIGPSSARQLLVHLSLVSTNVKGHAAYAQHQSICDARDL